MKFKKFAVISAVIVAFLAVGIVLCGLKPADIKQRAAELQEYCVKHGYNSDYAILVDLGRFSFQRRLYVYDLKNDKIVMASLSGHGSGGNSTIFTADFSNVNGSHCSSLGHYKIGVERMMYSRHALAYELDGLDKTNSNARSRSILVHSSAWPLSLGCVTLPFGRYDKLSEFLKTQKNVIMWVYN